jgi:hypothetical protein
MLTSGVGRAGVNDYTLFDDFEYSGNWWLPGRQQGARFLTKTGRSCWSCTNPSP